MPSMWSGCRLQCFHFRLTRAPLLRSGWTENTFISSSEAEFDLCHDRPRFIRRDDSRTRLPRIIWGLIVSPSDLAQIQGFRELFVLLDTNTAADDLRQLVVDYFNDNPPLRAHLSEP